AWFIRVHPCSSVANSLRSKINPLHAMVLAVDDVHFATAVHGERPGAAQPARLAARPAPGAERHAVERELLDPMVAVLYHIELLAALRKSEIVRIRQLSRFRAGRAPVTEQFAVAAEDLDAVIACVGDVEVAVRPDGEGAGPRELSGLRAGAAPALHQSAFAVELGNALVLAELGDVVEAVGVLHHVADVAKLPRLRPRLAAEATQLFAFGRVDAEAVVVRIADNEVAVAVDAQPARPAVAVVRRFPAVLQIMAVAVEDLNAGREVNEIEMIVSVDGHGARLFEIAVSQPLMA